MRVLVTGANGRIGRVLVPALLEAGHEVRAGLRAVPEPMSGNRPAGHGGALPVALGDLGAPDEGVLLRALEGIDVLVHLAAVAHRAADPALIESVNAVGAVALARAASRAGVSALVLASSVHAGSPPGRSTPFETHTQDAPAGAYGAAKRQAETGIAAAFGGRLAVLRFAPVLLGPPAGNLGRLLRVSRLPLPPPLAGLDNRRSYASPGTVVAALRGAVERPIHGVVPVADAAPLATSALVAAFRAAGGAALPAWPLPRALIRAAIARLAGDDQAMALCDPFIVSTAALEAHGLRPVADSLPAVRAYAADSSGGA